MASDNSHHKGWLSVDHNNMKPVRYFPEWSDFTWPVKNLTHLSETFFLIDPANSVETKKKAGLTNNKCVVINMDTRCAVCRRIWMQHMGLSVALTVLNMIKLQSLAETNNGGMK